MQHYNALSSSRLNLELIVKIDRHHFERPLTNIILCFNLLKVDDRICLIHYNDDIDKIHGNFTEM